MSNTKAELEKTLRLKERELQALKDRLRAERERKALALAEDPKDGEVLVSEPRLGLCFLDLGRRHKVSPGTKFTIWRAGKGDVRENVAVVRVIEVEKNRCKARILRLYNPRVPVTAGMNASNPFYDPYKPLRVYIYGDLRSYPTEVARRRLAASGAVLVSRLDDTVDVIVVGEPRVTVSAEAAGEEEGALAMRRANIERDKRLKEIMDTAASIGAVVVTEDVLRTFIDY